MLWHGWTLKTLCWVKQASCRRTLYCLIPLIWTVQSRKIHRVRKKLSGCWGISGKRVWKKWRLTANGYKVSLWRDENVPKLWQRLYSCEYAKNDRIVDFKPVDVQYAHSVSVKFLLKESIEGARCLMAVAPPNHMQLIVRFPDEMDHVTVTMGMWVEKHSTNRNNGWDVEASLFLLLTASG